MIVFSCHCGARLKVPEKLAGQPGKCPRCGGRVVAPQSGPSAPPEAPREPAASAPREAPRPAQAEPERPYVHLVRASAASTPWIFQIEAPENQWHAAAGGTIPFLPDFTDSEASESERRQIAVEVLNRQISFIQTIATHKEATFALRFIARPEAKRIDLALFAKCVGPSPEEAERMARQVWRTVEQTFPRGYPLETFSEAGAFADCFQPFAYNHVVEIRRPEAVQTQEAYVVYPLAWGLNAMVGLCAALARAQGRHLVSIILRPTRLSEEERRAINWMASRLREAADHEFRGFSTTQRVVNEEARVSADLYANMLRQLSEPLVMKIHIAGAEPIPEALVATLGSEITHPSEAEIADQDGQSLQEGRLSRRYETIWPADRGESMIAQREVYLLETYPWGKTLAPGPLRRLRYLVDSRQANCAFRLPIAPTDRIDGIVVQPYCPFSRSHRMAEAGQACVDLGCFIHRGQRQDDGPRLPLGRLTRHALVAGFTGSGKTTTCMHLLAELWIRHRIPWLVLEPAKAEYRQLLRLKGLGEDLRIFTLGNESCSPFRLNPLEPVPGYPIQAHLDWLRSAFLASFSMWEPLPRILERCVREVFRGRAVDGAGGLVTPPTLKDLVDQIDPVIEQLGYDREARQRSSGALHARLESLLMGNKGRMLNCSRGVPMEALLEGPAILELRWITDQEERSLILAVLLTRLYERLVVEHSRRAQEGAPGGPLRHVTLFEEAHQLLAAAPSRSAGPDGPSVESKSTAVFANMLAEIRAFGEGLIIADQIPGKLLPDVVKNTDLKIAHTLRAPDDRSMMARAMNLNRQQEAYVGMLPAGQAAVHFEGLEEAVLVQFPNFKADRGLGGPETPDEDVAAQMASFRARHADIFQRKTRCPACSDEEACPYREAILASLEDKALAAELSAAALATLAGGDSRRRLLFVAGARLRQRTRLKIDPAQAEHYLRCCCAQTGQSVVARHAEEAGLESKDVLELLRDFVACHDPLIQRATDHAERLKGMQKGFSTMCRPMFLPSAGCELCRRQCMFFHPLQDVLRDSGARKKALEALDNKAAAHEAFPRACLDAVGPVVCNDHAVAPHAAYCFAALLLESKGVSNAAMFRRIAEDLGVAEVESRDRPRPEMAQ